MKELIGQPQLRPGIFAWLGALAVHVLIVVALQFTSTPAESYVEMPPEIEAVRVQAMDARTLEERRAAYQRALREAERKRQREKEARETAQRERKQAEKKRKEEKARQKAEEKRKREQAAKRKKAEAERVAAEAKAEALRKKLLQAERAEAKRKEGRRQAENRRAQLRARQANAWKVAIKSRIERLWLQPPTTSRNPCEVVVEQNEIGEVLSAFVRQCAASKAWQESLRSAVMKASPLPQAPQGMFDRKLVVTFYPGRDK